jgi:hypothetical protein
MLVRLYETIWLGILVLFATAQASFLLIVQNTPSSPSYHISELHFFAWGNDFVGTLLQTATVLDEPQYITMELQQVVCEKQVHWLYYNNQRWQRLFPLDTDTLISLQSIEPSYLSLALSWWWYTQCSGSGIDTGSILGQITFDHNGLLTHLIAWGQFNMLQNSYSWPLRNSLQYLENTPIGYIYDSNGGIGFIGWQYTQHQSILDNIGLGLAINDLFILSGNIIYDTNQNPVIAWDNNASTSIASITSFAVQGIIAITQPAANQQIQDLEASTLAMVLPTTSFNTADSINTLRKKSRQICQWRFPAVSIQDQWPVLCFFYDTYSPDNQVHIDLSTSSYNDKTIIITNADLHMLGTMTDQSQHIDLFIDNGNIVRDISDTIGFAADGYPSSNNPVAYGALLKGNIFIDGLFIPALWTAFDHKVYMHGKLLSLHSPSSPAIGKITHITNKFGASYQWFIDITSVFGRRCDDVTLQGTDGTLCPVSAYHKAPFVLIDKTYPSRVSP